MFMDTSNTNSTIDHSKSLIVIIVTLCFSVSLFFYGMELVRQINETQTLWQYSSDKANQKNTILNQIKQNHDGLNAEINLKNYITKRQATSLVNIDNDFIKVQQSILNYQSLSDVSVSEAILLVKLTSQIESLKNNYILATNLIASKSFTQLTELNSAVPSKEFNDALGKLFSENNIQFNNSNNDTKQQVSSTINYITGGSIFLLLFIGYGFYILFLNHKNRIERQQLQNKGIHMASLFDNSPLATIAIDQYGVIIQASYQATHLFDAERANLLNANIEQLFSSEAQQSLTERLEQSHIKHTSENKQLLNIITQRGREIPVELTLSIAIDNAQQTRIITLRNMSSQKRKLKILNENQAMLNQAQEIAHIGSWNWELATDKLIWSDEAYRIYGYKPNEIEITNDILMARIPPQERELVGNAINESVIFNKDYQITHHIIRVDGTKALVQEQGKVIRDEENKAVRMIGTVSDITSQKDTEQQLKLSANVFEHTVEAIVVCDEKHQILKVNKAFKDITGFKESDAIGTNIEHILRANYFDHSFYQNIWNHLIDNDHWQGEIWNVRSNGSVYPTHQNISVIKDPDGSVIQYLCIFSDISKHKLIEEQINEMAHFDQLTLLPNRQVFAQRLKQDIDGDHTDLFTAVFSVSLNKSATVKSEDQAQLLISTAKLISHIIRKQDSVMRSGKDEFSIIIRNISAAEDAYIIAEKILKELTMPLKISHKKIVPGCSIGVALHPTHGEDYQDLIKCSNTAMFAAREENSNKIKIYNNSQSVKYSEQYHQINELCHGIELNELRLNYMPRIDLNDCSFVAATATILWEHPQQGMISLDKYQEILSDEAIVKPLFNWLLQQAAKQVSQWSSNSLKNTTLEIIVPPTLLSSPGLSELINEVLTTYQLKPQHLQLEINEQAILNNPDVAIAELEAIKQLKVAINFEKLGENYSSFKDIERIGFNNVTTQNCAINQQQPEILLNLINKVQSVINELPLSDSLTTPTIFTGLKTITQLNNKQEKHFITGRELTLNELLELSNAINVHTVLNQREQQHG